MEVSGRITKIYFNHSKRFKYVKLECSKKFLLLPEQVEKLGLTVGMHVKIRFFEETLPIKIWVNFHSVQSFSREEMSKFLNGLQADIIQIGKRPKRKYKHTAI